MAQDRKEYLRAYHQAHKKEHNARSSAWYQAHKKEKNDYQKEYNKAHKEEIKEYQKEYHKEYSKADVNSFGQTKESIRIKSVRYLNKYGTKIDGYEIHHCCTYDEPYKFIYCSKEMHLKIHSYLRQHNIDADSNHYEQIKHLLDDKVVLYGI